MEPLEENGAVYEFDTAASSWRKHAPQGAYPAARSYHCATATPDAFVIHAGCGSGPRLSDVWSFSPATGSWTQLPDAPGVGRGGATLAAAGGALWRFGGFNGITELGGAIDTFQKEWTSTRFGEEVGLARDAETTLDKTKTSYPGPRSVAGMHAVGDRLVVVMGEGKPSITGGHDAAGNFWDDVWTYSPQNGEWAEVSVAGEKPNARGWFASDGSANGVVVHGGLDDGNTRLADVWVLKLE